MEDVVSHLKQIANGQIAGCSELICDEIEARLVEAIAKPGNANVDDDDDFSTYSWIMNEQYH